MTTTQQQITDEVTRMFGKIVSADDLKGMIEEFSRRIFELEQAATSSEIMGTTPVFEEIVITDPDGIFPDYTIDHLRPDPVTDIHAVSGAFYDNVFVDIDWDEAVTGRDAVSFEVQLYEKNAGPTYTFVNNATTSGLNYRFDNLKAGQNYSIRIVPISAIGVRGNLPAYTDFTASVDATVPPAPIGVVLARGATTVIVKFTPLTAVQAPDVANGNGIYEVQIDTTVGFASGNLRSAITNDQVISFSDIITESAAWYGRVRAIDGSGNVGPWSATSAAITGGGVNDSMIIADLSAAKITAGFLSASRLQANTITVDKLATGTMTAQIITMTGTAAISSSLAGGTGYYINATGIRLYKAGVETVTLDAATGDAAFAGSVSASYILSSAFNWGNGVLDSNGMRIFGSNLSSYNTNRAVTFIKPVANYDAVWSIWSPNYGELHIDRINRGLVGTGSLAEIYLGGRTVHIAWDPVAGTEVASATWGSTMTMNVYGEFFASYKDFVIDHPSDPENKLLIHAVLEGPEHGVFYRGRGRLHDGMAVVELPDYFDDLMIEDCDPTVQITPILRSSVKANVPIIGCSDVKDGKFQVFGNDDMEFFWTVFGARPGPEGREFLVEIDKGEMQEVVDFTQAVYAEMHLPEEVVTAPPLTSVG